MYLLLYKLRSESDPDVDISISFSNDIWTEDGELEEQLLANDSSLSDRTALFVLNSHISRWLPIIYILTNIDKNQMKFIYLFWHIFFQFKYLLTWQSCSRACRSRRMILSEVSSSVLFRLSRSESNSSTRFSSSFFLLVTNATWRTKNKNEW